MSNFIAERAYDYFDLGDESDQESAESSEDEIDIILHGTPEQRRRLRHVHEKEQKQRAYRTLGQLESDELQESHLSSSEDEFEREMNAELDKTVHMLEQSRGRKRVPALTASEETGGSSTNPGSSKKTQKTKHPFYDDIYFDSEDEDNYEGQGDTKVRRRHAQLTNEDLLYDPDMDDEDQRWVDERRQQQNGASSDPHTSSMPQKGKKSSGPTSDAVLDCPACMTTLCIDCQRHDIYPNQYRAMFVMNCKINKTELLSVPEQAAKKKFKKAKVASQTSPGESSDAKDDDISTKDKFHPVLCVECDTVVGVFDFDEVYHFFNILPSQP